MGGEDNKDCWDGHWHYAKFCNECRKRRCKECKGKVIVQVFKQEGRMAGEGSWAVCTPCLHGFCTGSRLNNVVEGKNSGVKAETME